MSVSEAQDARTAVLERIRAAKGSESELSVAMGAWPLLPRQYHRGASVELEAMLHKLTERLVDYDAVVERCSSAEVPAAVARAIEACGAKRVLAPAGLDVELPRTVERVEDNALR